MDLPNSGPATAKIAANIAKMRKSVFSRRSYDAIHVKVKPEEKKRRRGSVMVRGWGNFLENYDKPEKEGIRRNSVRRDSIEPLKFKLSEDAFDPRMLRKRNVKKMTDAPNI